MQVIFIIVVIFKFSRHLGLILFNLLEWSGNGNACFQDGGHFREKRTSITTTGAKTQAFDIFPAPLISHYPLLLSPFPAKA
jgi:hypothetical protein